MRAFRRARVFIPDADKKRSATLDAVLTFIYRKEILLSNVRYANSVIKGLLDLNLVKKVFSKKGTFYFKTDKAESFKAIDFAKEYLWAYHNPIDRQLKNDRKLILCFDNEIKTGHGLVEIDKAIKKGYV